MQHLSCILRDTLQGELTQRAQKRILKHPRALLQVEQQHVPVYITRIIQTKISFEQPPQEQITSYK